MLKQLRNSFLARALEAIPTVGFAKADGVMLMPACDRVGVLWTRDTAGVITPISGPGSITRAFSAPAAATAPSATIAATAGLINQLNAMVLTLAAVAAQGVLNWVVRDGATGVGTIIWQGTIGPLAAGTSQSIALSGLAIQGTTNTALCVEFTAAPAATNFGTVAINGKRIDT